MATHSSLSDTDALFLEHFSSPFDSWDAFASKLNAYQELTHAVFKPRNSTKVEYENRTRKEPIPEKFKYSVAKFICIHYGQPVKKGAGIRKVQRYLALGCPAYLTISYSKGALRLTKWHANHENHTLDPEANKYYPRNRRLNRDEKEAVEDIIKMQKSNHFLKAYLRAKTNKAVLIQDVKNLKKKSRERNKNISSSSSSDTRSSVSKQNAAVPDELDKNILNVLSFFTSDESRYEELRGKTTQVNYGEQSDSKFASLYNLFTKEAVRYMIQNHSDIESCSALCVDSGIIVSVADISHIVSSSGKCHCPFSKQYALPCIHATFCWLKGFTSLEALTDGNQWLLSNSKFSDTSTNSPTYSALNQCPSTLTLAQKWKAADSLIQKLNTVLSRSGLEQFERRMMQLEFLIDMWERDEDVLVSPLTSQGVVRRGHEEDGMEYDGEDLEHTPCLCIENAENPADDSDTGVDVKSETIDTETENQHFSVDSVLKTSAHVEPQEGNEMMHDMGTKDKGSQTYKFHKEQDDLLDDDCQDSLSHPVPGDGHKAVGKGTDVENRGTGTGYNEACGSTSEKMVTMTVIKIEVASDDELEQDLEVEQDQNIKAEDCAKDQRYAYSLTARELRTESDVEFDQPGRELSGNTSTPEEALQDLPETFHVKSEEEMHQNQNSCDTELHMEANLDTDKMSAERVGLGSSLNANTRNSTDEIPYVCEACDKVCSRKNSLSVHDRLHTGKKPYTCDVFGKEFKKSETLKVHKRIHTGEKPYRCDICHNQYTNKNTLHTYMMTHKGEKAFQCDVCGIGFYRGSDLRRHKWIHTGENCFGCDICGNRFADKSTLNTHQRTHTGEKPYKCEICGAGFIHGGRLIEHKWRHTKERSFKCDICSQVFPGSGRLQEHKWQHKGDKPYQCDVCCMGFTCRGSLLRHKKGCKEF